jgi:hypothetical protein
MLIVPALEYERTLRQNDADLNKIILHREGKFYRVYEYSLWLIKTIVCTEEFQRARGDEKLLSAKRYRGNKTGEYAMSGFPVESLSKFIPEYKAVRPMEGGDDLEIEITLPDDCGTREERIAAFTEWKQTLEVYESQSKNNQQKQGKGGQRSGMFQIAQQLLAYPVEKKSSAENVEFISALKQQAAELL